MTKEEILNCLTTGTTHSPANKETNRITARLSADTQQKGSTSSQNQTPKPPTSILRAATKGSLPKVPAGGESKSSPLRKNPRRLPDPRPEHHIYKLQAQVKPTKSNTDPLTMLKTRLQEILNKLKESDPTLILYSTSSDTDTTIWLDQPEEISTFSFTQLREFFYGVFPQHKGGRVYSQLRIGHTIPTQEFCQDISWWAKAEDVRLDRKPLQYIKTANIGFFLFSHEYMHVLKLEEELNAEYSAHTMDDTAVLALSFRPVWDGVNSFTKKRQIISQGQTKCQSNMY